MDRLADSQAALTRSAFRTLNSVVKPAVLAGAGNPLPVGAGAIVLETRGRISGRPRQVPLLATRFGDKVVVSTVRSDSQWLKNIDAEPEVVINLYGKRRTATAEVSRGPLNVVVLKLD